MGNMSAEFLQSKLTDAKTHFERALDCKQQFFWYKRYVAWSELLTIVKLCEELSVGWQEQFTEKQADYIGKRVMSSRVLDEWYETNREHVG